MAKRADARARVWLYAPTRKVSQPIGCVVVPPAGSNLITGMSLSAEDRAEHLPYVKAGYIVASFDISGARSSSPSDVEMMKSIVAFRDSKAGVEDAKAALDVALAVFPSIDNKRVYAAGHSSAGTLALLFAALDDRVRAVAAFAPSTDVVAGFSATDRAELERALPGYSAFLKASSPVTHAQALARKPVFLFHAADDETVDPEETQRLFAMMKSRNPASQRVTVDSGGHYDPMVREGVPKAIKWFNSLARP